MLGFNVESGGKNLRCRHTAASGIVDHQTVEIDVIGAAFARLHRGETCFSQRPQARSDAGSVTVTELP